MRSRNFILLCIAMGTLSTAPAIAEERKCTAVPQEDIEAAELAFEGTVTDVQAIQRGGDGFVSVDSGLFWVEPRKRLHGKLPRGPFVSTYFWSLTDTGDFSGEVPKRGDRYLVLLDGRISFYRFGLQCG